jgi:alkylation response protein AidB-like acyl-CoA dehydrogenase
VRVSGADGQPGWSLSGRKIFSTGAPGLQWLMVWGATADDDPDGVRSGWFAVPGGTPGVRIEESWDHLGMRASASHDVVFEDVRIPADHAFGLVAPGAEGNGGRSDELLGWMIALLLAAYRGAAHAARDWLAAYLRERTPANLGAPLASLPRLQSAYAEIAGRIGVADRLCESLAADIDAGGGRAERAAVEAPLLKVAVTRELIEAVGAAVALVGNAGLTRRNPLERHYRDVLCSRVHTPQDDAVLLAAGRAALTSSTPQQGA